jgi:hypothetical protein
MGKIKILTLQRAFQISLASLAVGGTAGLFAWKWDALQKHGLPLWVLLVGAIWLLGPPLWFLLEWYFWHPNRTPDEIAVFKYNQDLAKNFWFAFAGIVVMLVGLK